MSASDFRDAQWMARALKAGRKGIGKTSFNPPVGAVIVKNGRWISEAHHLKAGGPHAEILALRKAGARARGATLYVTLEPCSTHGKTPPCTRSIAAAGIRRVVFGAADPDPANRGGAPRFFSRKKIRIRGGVLKAEAEALIRPFAKRVRTGLPWVVVKAAQSLDGKIATARGESRWISSKHSRRRVQELRAQSDAVLCGIGTVLRDNPRLHVRNAARQPLRIVADSRLRISEKARLFRVPGEVIVATTAKSSPAKRRKIAARAEVMVVPARGMCVDLRVLMKRLASRGVSRVLAEGGGELTAGLFSDGLADELFFFTAPKIIGGRQAPTAVEGEGVARLRDALATGDLEAEKIGPDLLIHTLVKTKGK